MKYRTLFNDHKVAEAPKSVPMTIDSKCPRKWVFVDLETGDIWVHKSRRRNGNKLPHTFYDADRAALEMIGDILLYETLRPQRKTRQAH